MKEDNNSLVLTPVTAESIALIFISSVVWSLCREHLQSASIGRGTRNKLSRHWFRQVVTFRKLPPNLLLKRRLFLLCWFSLVPLPTKLPGSSCPCCVLFFSHCCCWCPSPGLFFGRSCRGCGGVLSFCCLDFCSSSLERCLVVDVSLSDLTEIRYFIKDFTAEWKQRPQCSLGLGISDSSLTVSRTSIFL